MNWEDCLQHAAVSDIGMRRTTNQDSFEVVLASDYEAWQQRGHLFVVADGMGAHAAGELASEMAVSGITLRYFKYEGLSPAEALEKAILDTNTEVYQRGQANLEFYNMGTTTSVLALVPEGALVAHVGDSRVYRLRGKRLDQLTFDHSLVWELRSSGQLDGNSELARVVPKNIITRSVGPNATVNPDIEGPFPIAVGDTFLLCSDGLSGPVADHEIGAIIGAFSPTEAAQALIDLANLRGGPDNITAVVVRVVGDQVATKAATNAASAPRAPEPQPVHPAVWAIVIIGVLTAVVMGLAKQNVWAGLACAAALIALAYAATRRWSLTSTGVAEPPTRAHYGKGPYTSLECGVDAEFLEEVGRIANELRAAAVDEKWNVDLTHFDGLCDAATKAADAGRYVDALQSATRAISSMMTELRRQKRR